MRDCMGTRWRRPGWDRPARVLAAAALLLLAAACTLPPGDAGFSEVAQAVEARTGAVPAWGRTDAERQEIAEAIDRLLEARVGPDEAVAIAFLNSPRLQAGLEELGIARADFLAALFPPNPFVEAMRFGGSDGGPASLEIGIAMPLLGLILWPARIQVGEAGFEAAKAAAMAMLAEGASDVRMAYVEHVAARQEVDLYEQAESAGNAAATAARAIFEAGNIARVDYDRQRQFAAQMTIERMRAEAEVGPSRERLAAALGLSPAQADRLRTLSRLPAPPTDPVDPVRAGHLAGESGFQVAAAAAAMQATAVRQGMTGVESLLGNAELLAEFERENGWSSGFGAGARVPLDLGLPARGRADARVRQAYQHLLQARLDSQTGARAAAMQVDAARRMALYQREVALPVSAAVFDGVVRDFNAMQIGIFQLLQARRDRVDAGRGYVDAVARYWRARAALERHVRFADVVEGAPAAPPDLSQPDPAPPDPAPPDPATEDQDPETQPGHHHG